VGEEVNLVAIGPGGLIPLPVSVAWSTTDGKVTPASGPATLLTAPDTKKKITVTAGTATKDFEVIAPTSVAMDREPGTGVFHTKDRPDSGIRTRVFLGPDTVNFNKARYRELDVAGTGTGHFSCNPAAGGHCGVGGGGPCPDKALTDSVVAGKGTQSLLGDCALSGDCCTAAPFAAGSVSVTIPYEYKVGAGAFRKFFDVPQAHSVAADGSTLASSKAGASGSTTVAAATVAIPGCAGGRCP
jgi:hypothetical protein